MGKDSLGNRMKFYEQMKAGERLMPTLPVCVRLDGRSFSNFTRDMKRPFDADFHAAMCYTTEQLVKDTNAIVGYTQSDEISLIFYSPNLDSQIFFDGKVQKMVSVLASMATFFFQQGLGRYLPDRMGQCATFDCRVWNVPSLKEAVNTLVWREIDATKNSVSMAARSFYSHNQLHNKSGKEMQEMMFQKGQNWNDYPVAFKRGTYFRRRKECVKFSTEELERLPEKHEARRNPDLVIERSVVREFPIPPITRIANRVDVFFDGADPVDVDPGKADVTLEEQAEIQEMESGTIEGGENE